MPQRYFISHTPRQIARHALVAIGHRPEQAVHARRSREMRGELHRVHPVHARRARALLERRRRAHGADINILGANVYTTRDGLALEVYRVTTPAGRRGRARRWPGRSFLASLERVLARRGRRRGAAAAAAAGRSARAPRRRRASPKRCEISNEESDFYTIVDVLANDRLGLLHDLTRTIADHGSRSTSRRRQRCSTRSADTFYLKDARGAEDLDEGAIEALRRDLLAAIRAGDVRCRAHAG